MRRSEWSAGTAPRVARESEHVTIYVRDTADKRIAAGFQRYLRANMCVCPCRSLCLRVCHQQQNEDDVAREV